MTSQTIVDFDQETFARIAKLADQNAGLLITPAKASLVHSRLSKIIRNTAFSSISDYVMHLQSTSDPDEIQTFVSALTTNVSNFYREPHHFKTFSNKVLAEYKELHGTQKSLRIWSAGCSTGQEPYSIALEIAENLPNYQNHDIKILCTDIDTGVLRQAKAARYDESQVSAIPDKVIHKYLTKESNGDKNIYRISKEIRSMTHFRHLNLQGEWPISGKFNAIFCRNVMIYFSEENQSKLSKRFSECLRPGGYLFVGHSERVSKDSGCNLVASGITTYRRLPN